MIGLLISTLMLSFLFLVLGTSIKKRFRLLTNHTDTILFGLVCLNTITTFLSIFFALNFYILIILFIICLCLCFYIRREILLLFTFLKSKKIILLCGIPIILIAFIISLGQPLNWDTGLYHLQSIKWIEEYPVIPGLANLHGRFGFNPNIFTVFSLTSFSRVFGQEIFSVNFTLFSLFVLYFINRLYIIYLEESISNNFIFILLVFITILNLSENLSSPSPDFISTILPLYILSKLSKHSYVNNELFCYEIISIVILSIYILTVKLSALPILIFPLLLMWKFKIKKQHILWLIPICVLIVLPWLVRNVVLTGWLVYPFPMADLFNFDWKVQLSQVQLEKLAITGFARSHGHQVREAYYMNVFEWIPLWWKEVIRPNQILFLASVILPLIIFYNKNKIEFINLAIIFTSFIGVLYWFMLAPDFRFGKAFIVIGAISPLLYYKFKVQLFWEPNFKIIYPFFVVIVMLIFYFGKSSTGFNIVRIVRENLPKLITPDIIEIPENIKFKTYQVGGIKFYAPTEEDRCFNHCLPCTGYPDTTLSLRGKTLQSGFKNGKPKL